MVSLTAEIACIPAAISPEERAGHFALARELFTTRVEELRELPEGYELRFAPDVFDSVARFVANERKCCPFVDFEITLTRAPSALWLRMTGPQGTRSVLQAELQIADTCSCGSGESDG